MSKHPLLRSATFRFFSPLKLSFNENWDLKGEGQKGPQNKSEKQRFVMLLWSMPVITIKERGSTGSYLTSVSVTTLEREGDRQNVCHWSPCLALRCALNTNVSPDFLLPPLWREDIPLDTGHSVWRLNIRTALLEGVQALPWGPNPQCVYFPSRRLASRPWGSDGGTRWVGGEGRKYTDGLAVMSHFQPCQRSGGRELLPLHCMEHNSCHHYWKCHWEIRSLPFLRSLFLTLSQALEFCSLTQK